MSQAGEKKTHNMSQGDEIFQLGVVIQECPFFFENCAYVSTVRKLGQKISARIEVAHFDRLASKIAATWSPFERSVEKTQQQGDGLIEVR